MMIDDDDETSDQPPENNVEGQSITCNPIKAVQVCFDADEVSQSSGSNIEFRQLFP